MLKILVMGSSSTIYAPQDQRSRKNTLSSTLGKLFGGGSSSKLSPTPRELQNVSPVNSSATVSSQSTLSDSKLSPFTFRPASPCVSLNGSEKKREHHHSLESFNPHLDLIAGTSSPNVDAHSRLHRQLPVAQRQGGNGGGFQSLPQSSHTRFVVHEDGSHEHHLKNAKRQEKLSSMIKNMLGAQKLRSEAKSAVPDILLGATANPNLKGVQNGFGDLPPLLSGAMKQFSSIEGHDTCNGNSQDLRPVVGRNPYKIHAENKDISKSADFVNETEMLSFAEKYGRCQEVIGKGAFGVVRICHKKSPHGGDALYAVKEFKRKPDEAPAKYSRRLTSEFCISSSLKHVNIIQTLDLFQDAKGGYCEVMEYCAGGDLFTLVVTAGKLEYMEADCFFKQMIRGVVYMHDMGVCHRDLKPENLILTSNGVLKITDFGNGECFRMAWEKDVHLSGGICGSSPYIAPEEYTYEEFDPRPVDIWACGTIYMAMRTGRQLWKTAHKDDDLYTKYSKGRKNKAGYEPIEKLKRARCRNVIYSILDPVPSRRLNGRQILNSEWGREIRCCLDENNQLMSGVH